MHEMDALKEMCRSQTDRVQASYADSLSLFRHEENDSVNELRKSQSTVNQLTVQELQEHIHSLSDARDLKRPRDRKQFRATLCSWPPIVFLSFFFLDELHRNSSPHFDIRNLQETLFVDLRRETPSFMVGQPKNSIWEWELEELIPYAVDISVFGKRASRQKCVLVPITLRRHCGGLKKS